MTHPSRLGANMTDKTPTDWDGVLGLVLGIAVTAYLIAVLIMFGA